MKAYKRIEKISETVFEISHSFDRSVVVADIGTDHGYVAEKISKFESIKKVLATDISERSLDKLNRLKKYRNLDKIETILGDGLKPIESADICVIAGMGGFEIRKMIENQNVKNDNICEKKCNIFVLQPAQNIVELREWVMSNSYKIIKDFVFEDADRFYSILAIDVSKVECTPKTIFNLWIGRDSRDSEDFMKYILYLKDYLSFLNNVSLSRIKKDTILYQKYKLNKIVNKYLIEKENAYVKRNVRVSKGRAN